MRPQHQPHFSWLLVTIMLLSTSGIGSAQTPPPSSPGDWTIPANDITWLNGTALVQGDVNIYGTLIIDGGQLGLWGTSAGERDLTVYDGGELLIRNNSRIHAYSSNICYDFTVSSWATFEVTDSTIESHCSIALNARNWTVTDSLLEGNGVSTGITVSSSGNSSEDHSWNLRDVTFANTSSCAKGLKLNSHAGSSVHNSITWLVSNLTFRNAILEVSYAWRLDMDFRDFTVTGATCPTNTNGNYLVSFNSNSIQYWLTRFEIRDSPFSAFLSAGSVNLTNGLIQNTTSSTQVYTSTWSSNSASDSGFVAIKLERNASMLNVTIRNNHDVNFTPSTNQYRGVDYFCYAIYQSQSGYILDLEQVLVENNCAIDFTGSWYNPVQSRYQYNASSSSNGRCSLWNSGSGEKSHYTSYDRDCRITKAVGIIASGATLFENVSIRNNSGYNWAITSGGQNYNYQHGLIVNHGVELTSNSATNYWKRVSVVDNAVNGFNGWSTNTQASMNLEQVMFHGGSNAVLNITDSSMPQQSCNSFSPYQYTSNGGPFAHRTCVALRMDSGTVFATNTTYGNIRIDGGSLVRQWYLDVRIVDPDNQYTPNATVTLKELGIWTAGVRTTGPNGDLVRLWARKYSQTSSSTYTYTPHNVTVTLTNYTNSTSIYMSTNRVITMLDPTPDAFPGDITQDWDTDGDGYGDNISGNNPDHFINDATQWNDTDLDGHGDNQSGNSPDRFINDASQWSDVDGDGYGDNQTGTSPDRFINDATQWSDADGDGYGDNQSGNSPDRLPNDSTQWSDADGDGYGDNQTGNNPDRFPNDASQWDDYDGDGHGDNLNGTSPDEFPFDVTQWYDGDNDGLGDNQSGNNPDPYLDDTDNDGYNNSVDAFPGNPTQWEDNDGDGLGDNLSGTNPDPYLNDTDNDGTNNSVDPFPYDATQWEDTDQDGYGDNPNGTNPDPYLNDSDNDGYNNTVDEFPWIPSQWTDADGDGWGDNPNGIYPDDFPNDPTQWQDADGDGRGDNPNGNNSDSFPNDPTQWDDYDGDGHGDNPNGTLPDEFPFDATQWRDLDGDGYGDNYTWSLDGNGLRVQNGDAFVNDATQWSDVDGDGHGDNLSGTSADEYRYDPSQWRDADGDSFPDNYSYDVNPQNGLRDNQTGDAFPSDPTQWSDVDGDGYGDNSTGNNPDAFPFDPTQWVDADGDGLGDNPNGNNPDPTPGDTDNDGIADWNDAFPYDASQWTDTDGDGYGDNLSGNFPDHFPTIGAASNDTDGDGYPDDWNENDDGTNRGGLILDQCPLIAGDASMAGFGCPDADGDGYDDGSDAFPNNPTQWEDSDGDGYGDNSSGTFPDKFPTDSSQWFDRDDDGWGDNQTGTDPDLYPDDPSQWSDRDGDGYGDNPNGTTPDAFPDDPSQWLDSDGDGKGDNPNGTDPDARPYDHDDDGYDDVIDDCPMTWGISSYDRKGCIDTDGDSVSDLNDDFPNDPSKSIDTDGDGYPDPEDAFPSDATQWADADSDGLGDNPWGENPDPYLDDSDNDGVVNNDDPFPLDSTQWQDGDQDGLGDNQSGNNPDPFLGDIDNDGTPDIEDLWPLDPSQCCDSDGDGYGDNSTGTDGDRYPNDSTQCCDLDGDGWGDNPNGTYPDQYPNDPTQWIDGDGDGLGDNPNGMNPDPSPNDYDNDGVPDNYDAFPDDPRRHLDSDGDGIADEDEGGLLASINETDNTKVILAMLVMLLVGSFVGWIGSSAWIRNKLRNENPYETVLFDDTENYQSNREKNNSEEDDSDDL